MNQDACGELFQSMKNRIASTQQGDVAHLEHSEDLCGIIDFIIFHSVQANSIPPIPGAENNLVGVTDKGDIKIINPVDGSHHPLHQFVHLVFELGRQYEIDNFRDADFSNVSIDDLTKGKPKSA